MADIDTIQVVRIGRARETVFRWGFERFNGALDGEEYDDLDLDGFRQSAEYANHTLPDLRALAGYRDPTGVGTYTAAGPVAVIESGDGGDNPATADVVESNHVLNELLEYWENGAYEGARASTDE